MTRMSFMKEKEKVDISTFSLSFLATPFRGLKPSAVKGKVPPIVK